MSSSCVKHPMNFGEEICGECGHHFCQECVVFPFGSKKPPLCISCALELGGISSHPTGRPKLSRQSIRERRSIQRKAQKAARAEQKLAAEAIAESASSSESEATGTAEPAEMEEASVHHPWIEDSDSIAAVPGGWSQTFR
ncbi:MAG TPA: hypothetical protein VL068_11550 [Microthrixaceae bacterium]|nr:hypothetical protein [Microthrixaceae bacterium]